MNNDSLTRRHRPVLCALALVGAQLLTLSACVGDESLDDPWAAEDTDDQLRNSDNLILALTAVDMMAEEVMHAAEMEDEVLAQRMQEIYQGAPFDQLTDAERMEVEQHAAAWADQLQPIVNEIDVVSVPGLGDMPVEDEPCFTKCFLVLEFACENSQLVGQCFGFWECDAGNGAHECMDEEVVPEGEPCGNEFCQEGWKCAKWVMKPHECVQECSSDADCPGTQTCDRPWGTKFDRCR